MPDANLNPALTLAQGFLLRGRWRDDFAQVRLVDVAVAAVQGAELVAEDLSSRRYARVMPGSVGAKCVEKEERRETIQPPI